MACLCCRSRSAIGRADLATVGDAWLEFAIKYGHLQPIQREDSSMWWVSQRLLHLLLGLLCIHVKEGGRSEANCRK